MISVLTIGSLYWSSVSASYQQRDGDTAMYYQYEGEDSQWRLLWYGMVLMELMLELVMEMEADKVADEVIDMEVDMEVDWHGEDNSWRIYWCDSGDWQISINASGTTW